MTDGDVQTYRRRLVALAGRLGGDVSQLRDEALLGAGREAGGVLSDSPTDSADLGNREAEEDITLALLGAEEQTLAEVHAALARIARGTFGRCEACGKRIRSERLAAVRPLLRQVREPG
jgi:RNA polymerase-binding transcription factor DksA